MKGARPGGAALSAEAADSRTAAGLAATPRRLRTEGCGWCVTDCVRTIVLAPGDVGLFRRTCAVVGAVPRHIPPDPFVERRRGPKPDRLLESRRIRRRREHVPGLHRLQVERRLLSDCRLEQPDVFE